MPTQKSVLDAELEGLLAQLAKTLEHAALEEFLLSHPDIELPYPFINLFKSAYTRHVHSVRIRKRKEARAGGAEAIELLKPAEISKITEASNLVRQAGRGDPQAAHDLALAILTSGWDFEGRKEGITPEEDRGFLTDMAGAFDDEINDSQRLRLRLTGNDYIKWLAKQQFAVRH